MDTRYFLTLLFCFFLTTATAVAQSVPRQENLLDLINRMSDAEAVGTVNIALDQGVPIGEKEGLALYALAVGRSTLILPMIEKRIEELVKSPFPEDLYTNKSANPQLVILLLTRRIEQAGNQEALRQAGKLLKMDEKRFDRMVEGTMAAAMAGNRPFVTAYEGLEIGDPAIDKRIIAWAEQVLADEARSDVDMRHRWAEAMAERYRVSPTEEHWSKDPIASRLRPETAQAVHKDVLRLAADAWRRRATR